MDNGGTGTRGLIIRSYDATFAGQSYPTPHVETSVMTVARDGTPNVVIQLVPPSGINTLLPGDRIRFDVEWVTLPRVAEDYYGPNQPFLDHLTENPMSWKTLYREARGNDLAVQASGATVVERYPLDLLATTSNVTFTVEGGVGAVPVRIGGLKGSRHRLSEIVNGTEEPFSPAVHGHDFWQTDYDPRKGTYTLTFNLPLDGKPVSTWLLQAEAVPAE